MTRRIFVDTLTSIGAVEAGDNPAARIMLYKKRTESAANVKDSVMDLTKLDAEVRAEIETEFAKLQTRIDELAPPTPESVLKDADPKVTEAFEKQADEIVQLRKTADAQAKQIEAERDARHTVEVAKIVERFSKILGDDDAVAMLKTVPTETMEWLTGRLEHADGIIAKSGLFKEIGSGADDDDPAGQIQTLAVEKMTSNTDLTIAQARLLVRKERPDLATAERGN